MIQYPINLAREGTRVLVSFPDFPHVHTFGNDEAEALARAVDAIETYLMAMIEDREPIPPPQRPKRGQRVVRLPALTEAKLGLYRQMRAAKIGKAELAHRLNCHLPQVDRLLDLGHGFEAGPDRTSAARGGETADDLDRRRGLSSPILFRRRWSARRSTGGPRFLHWLPSGSGTPAITTQHRYDCAAGCSPACSVPVRRWEAFSFSSHATSSDMAKLPCLTYCS